MAQGLALDCPIRKTNDLHNSVTRLSTYKFWSIKDIITAEELSGCGFYYLSDRDRVKCIYCDVILRDWVLGDIATFEHMRLSPNCRFEEYMAARAQSDTHGETKLFNILKNCDVEQYMNTPAAKSLMEFMQFSKADVAKALRTCLNMSHKCPDVVTWLDTLLDMEEMTMETEG